MAVTNTTKHNWQTLVRPSRNFGLVPNIPRLWMSHNNINLPVHLLCCSCPQSFALLVVQKEIVSAWGAAINQQSADMQCDWVTMWHIWLCWRGCSMQHNICRNWCKMCYFAICTLTVSGHKTSLLIVWWEQHCPRVVTAEALEAVSVWDRTGDEARAG